MEGTTALICACTRCIFCKMSHEGKRLGAVLFFNDGLASETCGERIEFCSGCGEKLGGRVLLAGNSP